jgi:hypothetical protein
MVVKLPATVAEIDRLEIDRLLANRLSSKGIPKAAATYADADHQRRRRRIAARALPWTAH